MESSSFDINAFDVKDIDFKDLVAYWKHTNHFNNDKKIYNKIVRRLGPYECKLTFPDQQGYGLYLDNALVGATQIMQWDVFAIRFRTINILPEYRGNGLGWHLIKTAVEKHWNDYDQLFGWMSLRKLDWAIKNKFEIEEQSNSGTHVGVFKTLK